MRCAWTGQGLGGCGERCTEVGRLAGQGFCSLTDLSNSPQGGKGVRDNLGRPIGIDGIGSLGSQQLGVRQHDPELIIQAVEAPGAPAPAASRRRLGRPSTTARSRVRAGGGPSVGFFGTRRGRSIAPQRVRKDPDGSAGGPDVLDLARGNPVVNRATADSNSLAGLHDREGLAVHICSTGLGS